MKLIERSIESDADRVLDMVRSKRWRHVKTTSRTDSNTIISAHSKSDAPKPDQYRMQQLQQIYRRYYYSDEVDKYGSNGRSRLENLIGAAVSAQTKASDALPLRIGAAVLSSNGQIYSACNIHGGDCTGSTICAERMALLKAVGDVSNCTIEAMVISCADQIGVCPYPCGSCRQFMTTFGDFNVYCLRGDLTYEQTSVSELFPKAVPAAVAAAAPARKVEKEEDTAAATSDSLRIEDWSVRQVCDWVCQDLGLTEYRTNFEQNRVDGKTLLLLEPSDLHLLLDIRHAVHRKKILSGIDALKDTELMQHGIDYGQLHDYISILQRDQIALIAQLKETFDRLDVDGDGKLDAHDVRLALSEFTRLKATPEEIQDWIAARDRSGDGKVSFSDFALAVNQHKSTRTSKKKTERKSQMEQLESVDLVTLRRTFDAFDTSGNDSIEFTELVEGFERLGVSNCEAKAQEWFSLADVDQSCRISYAEFVLRYAQITDAVDLAPLQTVYESFDSSESDSLKPLSILPKAFEKLHHPTFDRVKLDKWCLERSRDDGLERISFADFVLACAVFCKSNTGTSEDEDDDASEDTQSVDYHRNRIRHLQQSGHVRLRERRRSTRRNTPSSCSSSEDDPNLSEEDEYRRLIRHPKELVWIKTTFQRFCNDGREPQRLNAVEAAQALTEVGVPAHRAQILRYLRHKKVTAGRRSMDVFGFIVAVAEFQSTMKERQIHTVSYRAKQHARHMRRMMDIEKNRYGKHQTQQQYDEYLRRRCKVRTSDESSDTSEQEHKHDGPRRRDNNASSAWSEEEEDRRRRRQRRSKSRRPKSDSSSSEEEKDRRRRRRRRRLDATTTRERRRRETKKPTSSGDSSSNSFHPKDRIAMRKYGSGTVSRIEEGGLLTIRFDSGRVKMHVKPSCVKMTRTPR